MGYHSKFEAAFAEALRDVDGKLGDLGNLGKIGDPGKSINRGKLKLAEEIDSGIRLDGFRLRVPARRLSGVYLVRDRSDSVVYVGSSENVFARFAHCEHDGITNEDSIEVIFFKNVETARLVESFLIEKLNPERNGRRSKRHARSRSGAVDAKFAGWRPGS